MTLSDNVFVQACMKIAWDVFRPKELVKYVKTWRDIIAPYFSPTKDYQGLQPVLRNAVFRWEEEVVDNV